MLITSHNQLFLFEWNDNITCRRWMNLKRMMILRAPLLPQSVPSFDLVTSLLAGLLPVLLEVPKRLENLAAALKLIKN